MNWAQLNFREGGCTGNTVALLLHSGLTVRHLQVKLRPEDEQVDDDEELFVRKQDRRVACIHHLCNHLQNQPS